MKFTEYLVFAALLFPTAALLTAAVISLAADNAAPDAQLFCTTARLLPRIGRSASRRNSRRAGPRTGASVGRRFRDKKLAVVGNWGLSTSAGRKSRNQAESNQGLPDLAIGVIPMAVGFPRARKRR